MKGCFSFSGRRINVPSLYITASRTPVSASGGKESFKTFIFRNLSFMFGPGTAEAARPEGSTPSLFITASGPPVSASGSKESFQDFHFFPSFGCHMPGRAEPPIRRYQCPFIMIRRQKNAHLVSFVKELKTISEPAPSRVADGLVRHELSWFWFEI